MSAGTEEARTEHTNKRKRDPPSALRLFSWSFYRQLSIPDLQGHIIGESMSFLLKSAGDSTTAPKRTPCRRQCYDRLVRIPESVLQSSMYVVIVAMRQDLLDFCICSVPPSGTARLSSHRRGIHWSQI